MKIKTITLLGILLTLSIFTMASCVADTKDPLPPSDVSAANCADTTAALNCFISTWDTTKTGDGVSAASAVVLPLVSDGTYDFYVDWGDGKEVEKITTASAATHTYDTKGEKTIYIAGIIKGWRFFVSAFDQEAGTDNDYGDAAKLLNVTQWGSLSLGNTEGRQFQGAENFNPTATDAPDVSETTDLVAAFYEASNFNGEIGNWDVSKVTVMTSMFGNATSFNNNGKPLDWGDKTSNVTDMNSMFFGAGVFNQDISAWDVGEVTVMSFMFNFASSFNNNGKPLDWGDKTSQVTSMNFMFFGASVFNQDVSKWDVAKVMASANFARNSGIENKPAYHPKFKPQ